MDKKKKSSTTTDLDIQCVQKIVHTGAPASPGLMVESRPNRCNLLRPKQKCSMMWKISTGFSTFPISGSSVMIKSMSTFAWMKSPSMLLRTVPLIPIKQCSWRQWNVHMNVYDETWISFQYIFYGWRLYATVPHLRPLENCLWVQCLGLAWIVLVGLDPTDVLTSPEAPLPQTLKWQVIRCRSDSLLLLKGYFWEPL